MTDCKTCQNHLPDLLLDPEAAAKQPELYEHLATCADCRSELAELRATFVALDDWTAPDPSPYFDSKLHARLREAEAAPAEGLWERLHAFFLFSTGRHLRPALTGALAFALVLGGGTFAGIYGTHNPPNAQVTSPAINDLRIYDNNAQAIQQMDQLLDDSGSDDAGTPPTT
jgi:anti-sigma factor RsiW